jgi:hypothetical protein
MGGDLDDDNLGKAAAVLSNPANWRGLDDAAKRRFQAEIDRNLTPEQQRAIRAHRR